MFLQNDRTKLPPELPKAALNLYNILDKIVLYAYLNYRALNKSLPKVFFLKKNDKKI